MTLKRAIACLMSVAVLGLPAVAAGAPTADPSAGPGPGGFATDNIEWVANVPLTNDTAGARKVGKYLYLTTSRDLQIFSLKDPLAPELVGRAVLPQQPYFGEEDVDTNGKILLISSFGTLYVLDVEDKTNPVILSELDGVDEHTYSCVLNCSYAYGSEGTIVDIRKPESPKAVGNWKEGSPAGSTHDVTEVKKGIVVTSTQPMLVLDARKNPAAPKLVAVAGNQDGRFLHGNLWPRNMKDRWLLVGGESGGPSCDSPDAAFMTWDTKGWKKKGTFSMVDEYRVENGVPTDGNAPADLFCAHWFSTHPTYKNGGTVAMAWYEHGTRLLDISKKGQIEEIGWFVPFAGSTSAAYWITKDILYAVDYNRGLDILKVTL